MYEGTVNGPIVVKVNYEFYQFSVHITKQSDPESARPTGTKIGTYTISKADNWTWRMTGLPVTGKDASGNTLYYTYYVVEQPVTNYTPSYSNNLGIPSGTITIKNTAVENPTITLPQTGGTGTGLYTLAGLTLCAGAALGLMKKRRKGGCD